MDLVAILRFVYDMLYLTHHKTVIYTVGILY